MPTAIARRAASFCRVELDLAHPKRRDRKARHAKLALRREVRAEIETGLADRAEMGKENAARAAFHHYLLGLDSEQWRNRSSDREQYDFLHLSRAAGVPEARRDRLKDIIFGPKCDRCGFRDCDGFCDTDYEYWWNNEQP